MRRIVILLVCVFSCGASLIAQSPGGTISGVVRDPSSAVIVGAQVIIVNDATSVRYETETNSEGIYVAPNLLPGRYRIQVSKIGFKTLIKPDIVLNVQDALAINFTLPIGAASETVTVHGGAPLINTQDGSVSTVIDRNFVDSLPLNGRSFNTLLQLTPGVVVAQTGGNVSLTGQFSIAGQRADATNFLVDGVSADFGVLPTQIATGSGTGSSQAFSVLGGTSSLVSVDDLQEFRIETSSFAPEFGRTPGGQVVLTTRSGTNSFHGGIFEYFRNTLLDANDWFANAEGLPRAPEHHSDFGGSLGGPILKDKTFFFTSYEGTRLDQPQTSIVHVPSIAARSSAPMALAPILNAYPVPNGPVSASGETAEFSGSFANRAALNAGSIRIDHTLSSRYSFFARYNEAPSELTRPVGGLSTLDSTEVNTRTLTGGLNMTLGGRVLNAVRANYSMQSASSVFSLDSFGGAVPVDSGVFLAPVPSATSVYLFQTFDSSFIEAGPNGRNSAKQMNVADDLSWLLGKHQMKFGADYRGIFLALKPNRFDASYSASTLQGFLSTSKANLFISGNLPSRVLAQSLSIYGQDSWKISPRLSLVYGLRWELSPAPGALGSTTLAAWQNVDTPAAIALAPFGSPIWKTTYANFAPRVGVAYSLTDKGDLVARLGAGVFYDLGASSAAGVAASFPNRSFAFLSNVSLPVGDVTPFLPAASLQPPYPLGIDAFDPNLKLPRSYQWNAALEKSIGGAQAISATYAGQTGRDLLRQQALGQPNANFSGAFLLTRNDAFSNYHSVQLQYRARLSAGLTALFNYTWSHSLDNASNDVVSSLSSEVIPGANDYASSDFDARHSLSGAVTYAIPSVAKSGPLSVAARDWSVDAVVVARSAFPFNGEVFLASPGPTGFALSRPDLVQGQPIWLYGAQCVAADGPPCAGGKGLNPAAFSTPSPPRQGNEGRNDIRGFGLVQADLSVGRIFQVTDRLKVQLRMDAFNAFNHPNFADPEALTEFGSFFLTSHSMSNQSLGGLNPLFQEGGPRSLQVSLRLSF